MGKENIFKPTIGQESPHQVSNDNGFIQVNFAILKNVVVKSTIFPYRNIDKYSWTSPDGKTHNQIDHVLIDRIWQSSVLYVRRFRGADCDTDIYLVIGNVSERLAVAKQAAQRFDRQRFNLRELNEPEVREKYQIEITNRFAALENSDDDEDVNRTRENIKEYIQTSAKESMGLDEFKQNKSWFDEECLGVLDQKKRAKMQWIKDPSQSTVGNVNNIKREVSGHFRNKKNAYLSAKLRNSKLTIRSKILGTCVEASMTLRMGYKPRCNRVEDEKGDLVADSRGIVARWRNYFSQLFNVYGVTDVRQAKIHTTEPLVPEPTASEFERAIDKLKSHKSPGINPIPAEVIKAGGRTIYLEIHKLIISICKKEKLPEEWNESFIVPIHKKGDKTDCKIIGAYQFANHLQTFIQHPALKVNSICEGN